MTQATIRVFSRKLFAIGRMPVSALRGLWQYRRRGRISQRVWTNLLGAHCASNGRSTTVLSLITRMIRPPRKPRSVDGLLGHFDVERQR